MEGGKNTNYRLEIYGNQTTYNIPDKVVTAVKNSPYFRKLYELKTFNEVVDEIYNEVSYVEPWVSGKGLGHASSAFCLIYKLFGMKVSFKQMNVLLNHEDSPYIRAIGFLYLRYGLNPKELWSWYASFIEDPEEIVTRAAPGAKAITIGRFVRDLLRNQKYFDTMLPRIPVTVMREMETELSRFAFELKKEEKASKPRSPRRGREDYPLEHHRNRRSRSRSLSRDRGGHRNRRDRGSRYDNRDSYRPRSPHRSRRNRRSWSRSRSPVRRKSRSPKRRRSRSRSPSRRWSRSRSPVRKSRSPSPKRGKPRSPSPTARARSEELQAVRAKYGSSGSTVSLDAAYSKQGTTGIVEKDVVLRNEVPKAVLEYQRRNAR